MLSLIEEIEQKVDKQKAEKFARKMQKGKGFDLEDFREHIATNAEYGRRQFHA